MDKQMIEEMAKEIARILFEDCLLNMGDRCEDCEWNGKETKEYDCQSLLVAKKLLEKYQPKIPENAVVLTAEEYERWQGQTVNIKKVRKVTAEKFAERMKAQYPPRTDERCTLDDCYMLDKIDEICKEITGEN